MNERNLEIEWRPEFLWYAHIVWCWVGYSLNYTAGSQAYLIMLFTEKAGYKSIHTLRSQPCKTNKSYTKKKDYKKIH